MWLDGEEAKVGQRVHELVAAALTADAAGEPFDVGAATRASFQSRPFGAGALRALRFRCSSAVTVYLLRFRPQGWTLVGTEVPLGAAVADIVWADDAGTVVIDELKTGRRASCADPRVAGQVERLLSGGTDRWGSRFAGVRLAPIADPTAAAFFRRLDGQVVAAPLPAGMGVR